jgi:hypothetical protein
MKSYSIEDLLCGTYYRPASYNRRHMGGIINYAEKREDYFAGNNYEAYVVRFRVDNSIIDKWATIAVRIN